MDSPTLIRLGAFVISLAFIGACFYTRLTRQRAERRAAALVRHLLTSEEFDQLEEHGYLDVPSRSTSGRLYRISGRRGLVTVMDAGEPVMRLCLLPARTIPEREYVLVHKLLLEGAEDDYWRRANHIAEGSLLWPDSTRVELWTDAGPGALARR
jgi:hypothetical protein